MFLVIYTKLKKEMMKKLIILIAIFLMATVEIFDCIEMKKAESPTQAPSGTMKLCGADFLKAWKLVCQMKRIRNKRSIEAEHPKMTLGGNSKIVFIFIFELIKTIKLNHRTFYLLITKW